MTEGVLWPELTGDTPRWQDLRVSLSSGRSSTNPPTFGNFRNGLEMWSFSATQVQNLYFEAQMPHGWVVGSEIRPHIHWSPGNSTNTGAVMWELEYSWANVNDPFPASTIINSTQAASGTPYRQQLMPWTPISGTGKRESSVFVCNLSRVGNNAADTFTGAAFGISVDFHYQVLTGGSIEEFPA
jgi:hypothetical protein